MLAQQQRTAERLSQGRLERLWIRYLAVLKQIDERVFTSLREGTSRWYSLDNDVRDDWGEGDVNYGLKIWFSPKPFEFYARLFIVARPLLILASRDPRARIDGIPVNRFSLMGEAFSSLKVDVSLNLEDLDGQVLRARHEVDEFYRQTYETPELSGAVPTIRIDEFSFTPPEVDVYRALQEQNLVFTPQCWIVHQSRRRYRTDFMIYYEGRAYALEIDGHDWHKSKDQRAYDAARDRFFDMRGIATIRFTASEVHNKLQQCMFELIDCLTKTRGRQV